MNDNDIKKEPITHSVRIDVYGLNKVLIDELTKRKEEYERFIYGGGLQHERAKARAEAIKEFEDEIEAALECNYEVRRKRMKSVHCGNDEFLSYLAGKIDCLRGLQEFVKEMVGERE